MALAVFLFSPGAGAVTPPAAAPQPMPQPPYFLPRGAATGIVSVSATGQAAVEFNVLTERIAVKETGPKETVTRFGEVYAFSPTFISVHADEPTRLIFWNLQPDDEHDFALMTLGDQSNVMMYVNLPPLKKTSYVFTFHRPGLYRFLCLRHQPEMEGEIEVLPAAPAGKSRARSTR
jgi:plastocyanin